MCFFYQNPTKPQFISQNHLHNGQQADAGESQKTGNQSGDGVDGEVESRKAGNGVEQPQADKTASGIEKDFPHPVNRRQH